MEKPRKNESHSRLADRFYLSAVVITAILWVALFILNALSDQATMPRFVASAVIYTAFGVCIVGLAWETLPIMKAVWSHPLRPYVVGAALLITTNVSVVVAKQLVNLVVPVDPTEFLTAVSVVAVFTGIAIWLTVIGAGLFVGYIFSIVYFLVLGRGAWWRSFGRVAGVVGLLFVFLFSSIFLVANSERIAATALAYTDFYTLALCSNYAPAEGERVAFMSNGDIVVASPDARHGYTFRVEDCVAIADE